MSGFLILSAVIVSNIPKKIKYVLTCSSLIMMSHSELNLKSFLYLLTLKLLVSRTAFGLKYNWLLTLHFDLLGLSQGCSDVSSNQGF